MLVQHILGHLGRIAEIPNADFDPKKHRLVLPRSAVSLPGNADDSVAVEEFQLGTFARDAAVTAESYNAAEHTVEMTFTTGARVQRSTWFDEDYYEELDVSPDAVNLDRLVGAPFLNAHARWEVGNVLGVVERAWLERIEGGDGKRVLPYFERTGSDEHHHHVGLALVRFSQRDEVGPVERDVADGILRQVSVGYSVQAFEKIEPRSELGQELELDLTLYVARAWTPLEISQVPIGADAGATIRSRAEREVSRCLVSVPVSIQRAASAAQNEGKTMIRVKIRSTGADSEIRAEDYNVELHELLDDAGRDAVRAAGGNPDTTPAATPAPTPPNRDAELEAARLEGEARARTRDQGIALVVRQAGLPDAVATELIGRADVTLDSARTIVLERLAAQSDRQPVRTAALIPVGGRDEDTTRRESVVEALLHRADPDRYAQTDRSRDYRGMSLYEIARHCLEVRGEPHKGLGKMDLVGRAITVGGSDLPGIVADVANKSLRDAYTGAPRTFLAWARRGTLPDFKPVSRVQYGQVPALVQVGPGGEFRYAEVADSTETYALLTYGRIISMNRQLIINDDMDALSRNPALFGRAAADLESDLVYAVLTANALMGDGVALFAAGHGNLTTGPGTVISITSLGVARALMRLQTGLNADSILNVAPRFLIVPAALETVAQQTVSPIAQSFLRPSSSAEVNVFAGSLEAIAEPRLDADSAISWYLSADPASIDTVEFGFLEGEEGVATDTRIGFDVDGIEIKARLDFGVKAIDHRGLYKNDGV
jgi:hypothetical protein